MRLTTLRIAYRNFTRNGRRFLLLGLAVCAGFFFVCTVQSLVGGLSSQISTRGARLYGGHVIIRTQDQVDLTPAREDAAIMGAIARTGIRPAVISHRTHFGNVGGIDGEAFFNGESLRIRWIIGCDWSNEGPRISQMQFVAGNPSGMTDPDGVLISDVTARAWGFRWGPDHPPGDPRRRCNQHGPGLGKGNIPRSEHIRLLHGLHGQEHLGHDAGPRSAPRGLSRSLPD